MIDNSWLDETQCWELLRSKDLGRLGYHLVDEVHIVPVNYVVDRQRVVFRTTPGSKLLGVVMDDDVAFEVDAAEAEDGAWSVLARGRARILEGDERREAEQLPLQPWSSGEKLTIVAIDVQTLTGRRIDRRAATA
ncbi:pyridoxamine 5'-phosphate oxidase family protein [Ornithinimicrobium ciconiae]|uniref:Pyridoxamine 5'-phosphate oxidase family protein n=1 Tax=Ornithinimicrobium ciconiae TaxID=2594265 RepID=A0A516G6W3_9MICO|nr:pyridoxamine 5'-phosphate oxidase family protein [Ornithinimicrobium ciconiae]QDO87258.1 pyridoxamine 5'-phosphate oxidase family protein [Ornithinimicrobium ciconiae]